MDVFVEDLLIMAIYLRPLFGVLLVCVLLADYVLPRCPRLIRFLDWVFDIDLEGDFDDE